MLAESNLARAQQEIDLVPENLPNVVINLRASDRGKQLGSKLHIPGNTTMQQPGLIANKLLGTDEDKCHTLSPSVRSDQSDFPVIDIMTNLWTSIFKPGHKSTEDVLTLLHTPQAVFRVLTVSCSSCSQISGDGTARIWDCDTETPMHTLKGHSSWVLCVAWFPDAKLIATGCMDNLPAPSKCTHWFASCSKDYTIRAWDVNIVMTISSHTAAGKLIHTLNSHAHLVNHVTLSTDFVFRSGSSQEEQKAKALSRFERAATIEAVITERLYQKQGNHVSFSPDGRIIASASFDNSITLWNARDGKFLFTLRGHVSPVYQCSFPADSKLLVSSLKDATLNIWDVRTEKLHTGLPGNQDEVWKH
ncbi:WD40-repeat-containing domain protein [Kalaharituber pfeilii]|nr:WD40-repeat-containing domain protein [Kalaharituber pfeilii]